MFKKIDLFPQDIGFRENNGQSFKTTSGALLSVFLILTVSLYAFNKTAILIGREDTLISEFTQKASLSEEEFSFEDTNAFSAFGLSFSGSHFIDADKYFQIEAYQLDNVIRGPEKRTNMTLHNCNDTDRKYFRDFDFSIQE